MISKYRLQKGGHDKFKAECCCAMELQAFLAGEPHSENPKCVCDVVSAYGREINDEMGPQVRNIYLLPLVESGVMMGTSEKDAETVAYVAMDRAIREFLPTICGDESLRELAPITDHDSARSSDVAVRGLSPTAESRVYAECMHMNMQSRLFLSVANTCALLASGAARQTGDWAPAMQLIRDMCAA